MNEITYLRGVVRTWRKDFSNCMTQKNMALLNAVMGLAGEAGEITDEIKKHIFHGTPLDVQKIDKEMGDLRYYYTILAELIGTSDPDIKKKNHDKLKARYPDGFVEGGGIREVSIE